MKSNQTDPYASMIKFDYIFVGAGLANIAAARMLKEANDVKVLVLESGSDLSHRKCPGVNIEKCVDCPDSCSILSGIGGTNALYGNKLCYFPASPKVLSYFHSRTCQKAWEWLDSALYGWFDSKNNRTDIGHHPLGIKQYESTVLAPDQFSKMVRTLASPLENSSAIKRNSPVHFVERDGNHFRVMTRNGEVYSTDNIVIGVGRSGAKFTEDFCRSLGISYKNSLPDIGIRIEAPANLFSDFYRYQEDPKLKRSFSSGSVRTFCAENGGIIVPVRFGDSYFAEGAYPSQMRDHNNVALMARSNIPLSYSEIGAWCKSLNQQYGSLRIGSLKTNSCSPKSIMRRLSSSLPEFPTKTHGKLMRDLFQILATETTPLFRHLPSSCDISIFAPAIDNYWPIPLVGSNLKTEIKGVHFLGDSLGLSRGYVQALTVGAAWAMCQRDAASPSSRPSKCLSSV